MKEKLYQIDNILMRLEIYIHNQDGVDITKARKAIAELLSQHSANVLVSGNEANPKDNKKDGEVAVAFADWIVKRRYRFAQMNYSNNGSMWFITERSIGRTANELYIQFEKEKAKATDR